MTKGLAERLVEEGARAVSKVASAVMSGERGQEALARAVGLAQRGLHLASAVQERALHAAGIAARPDYAELRKQVSRLRRKARELGVRLDEVRGGGDPPRQPRG